MEVQEEAHVEDQGEGHVEEDHAEEDHEVVRAEEEEE